MEQVKAIIERFGGLTAMAKALGHQNPTTVQGWRDRGNIPSRRIPEVIAAAKREGFDLALADFFPAEAA